MYEHGQVIDSDAISELPKGIWYVQRRAMGMQGTARIEQFKLEGEHIEPFRHNLQALVKIRDLDKGRVLDGDDGSIQIIFGSELPVLVLGIQME